VHVPRERAEACPGAELRGASSDGSDVSLKGIHVTAATGFVAAFACAAAVVSHPSSFDRGSASPTPTAQAPQTARTGQVSLPGASPDAGTESAYRYEPFRRPEDSQGPQSPGVRPAESSPPLPVVVGRPPPEALGPGPYALDELSREVPPGPFKCPKFETSRYLGTGIAYSSPIFVHQAFVEKLVALDGLVRAVAAEVYGRTPEVLHHLGGTECETTADKRRFSEHAMGNAIDVDGFVFAPLTPEERLAPGLPEELAKGFKVTLSWHYFSTTRVGKVHAKFLNRLAIRLKDDKSIFRTVLGPGYGDHWNHFHLDAAPHRFVFAIASKEVAK
jgi:hypothetical protein